MHVVRPPRAMARAAARSRHVPWILLSVWLACFGVAAPAAAACEPGVYGALGGDFVVVAPHPRKPPPELRYLFRDGRRGSTQDVDAPLRCTGEIATVRLGPADAAQWRRIAMRSTDTTFAVLEATLSGRLIEPIDAPSARPLVVMIQGSERTSSLDSAYALALAAQGLSVFVYDKRGAGSSTGEYTQNFALLAEDAVAAIAHARALAAGRFGRSGYFGASQGGWVAPLAATRTRVDFVAVAYGLVASPIEEDHAQLVSEARALGVEAQARPLIDRLSRATATLLRSRFQRGYGELAQVRRALAAHPWGASLAGEYSGAMVRSGEDTLRRLGVALFDNLELIWDYDAKKTLLALDTPLLWVLAEEDREAPIEETQRTLGDLQRRGKPITVYAFPDTDHGMFEFTAAADGQRTMTRITDGYLRLVGDWVRGDVHGEYGRGRPLPSAPGK